MKMIKVYREHLPAVRLIGKRYTDADRKDEGGYRHKWKEWFDNQTADLFKGMKALPGYADVMIGAMRWEEDFEYWIGMFFPMDTEVPEGMAYVDLTERDLGTCWVYGKEATEELYGPEVHNQCIRLLKEEGMNPTAANWSFERYHCKRFTKPDEKGNVILDYCITLEE